MKMLKKQNITYLYDGSFSGLLTAVFDAYFHHTEPLFIEQSENGQLSIITDYYYAETNDIKAQRVSAKISSSSSQQALTHIYYAYLSNCPEKESQIFKYIGACLEYGKTFDLHLTLDCVNSVLNLARTVNNEAHKYSGFIRFSKLENELYYAGIEPKNNVLPIIIHHFFRRYNGMPFIIHDIGRGECIVSSGSEWTSVKVSGMPALKLSSDEQEYRNLWKEFYDTIEIKSRHNEKQRSSCMPKRYWKHMTEFTA